MSTILKALKKLEENRAADGARQGDIAWDVLKEPPRLSRRSSRAALLGSLMVAAPLVALVWYLSGDTHKPSVISAESSREQAPLRAEPLSSPVAVTKEDTSSAVPHVENPVSNIVNTPGAASPASTGSQLAVSWIDFQVDPSARMALVNDLPVMVGTLIDGFVVERIHADRVDFSRQGVHFSVPLLPQD